MENFQNYCAREKWLAYVYMLDVEASHLLASNASSAVCRCQMSCSTNVVVVEQKHQKVVAHQPTKKKSPTNNYDASSLLHVADTCASNINKVAALTSQLIKKRVEQCNNYSTPVSMSSTPPTKNYPRINFMEYVVEGCSRNSKKFKEHPGS
jgi:hypothetical protein